MDEYSDILAVVKAVLHAGRSFYVEIEDAQAAADAAWRLWPDECEKIESEYL